MIGNPLPVIDFVDAVHARLPAYIVRAGDRFFFRRAPHAQPAIPAKESKAMPLDTPTVAETPRPKRAEMTTLAAVLAANPDYRPTGEARAFLERFVAYPESGS